MNVDKIYELFKIINETSDKDKIKCLSEYGMSLFKNTSEHFKKCANDPIFFIENYLTLRNSSGEQIPFKLYPKQKEYVNFFLLDTNEYTKYVKNVRQSGTTTLNCALYAWIFLFQRDKNILFVSSNQNGAKSSADITWNFLYQFESTFSHLFENNPSIRSSKFEIRGKNGSAINFISAGQLEYSLKGRALSYVYFDDVEFFDIDFGKVFQNLRICFGGKYIGSKLLCSSCKKDKKRNNIFGVASSIFHFDCLDVPTRDSKWIVETIKTIGIDRFENDFLP